MCFVILFVKWIRVCLHDCVKFSVVYIYDIFTILKKTGDDVMEIKWVICPTCGGKTRDRIREDTVLKNYPLYCPKCKQENLINVTNFDISIIKEPDTKVQSR